MLQLLKKSHRLEIEFGKRLWRPARITFLYEQGTLKDILEIKWFFEHEGDLKDWLFYFLSKKTKQSVKIISADYKLLNDAQIVKIVNFVLETYARGYFQVSDKPKDDGNDDGEQEETPPSSLIASILERSNETLETLLDMTWEQIEFLIEGFVWNTNEQTDEGKKRNRRKLLVQKSQAAMSDDEAKQLVADLENKLKNQSSK